MITQNFVSEKSLDDLLLPAHLRMLHEESGISDDVIRARGYRTITDPKELKALGFAPGQCRQVPGLLIPLHTTDGRIGLYVYRPDNPRTYDDKRKGKNPDGTYPQKVVKYELPKGAGTRVDCPPVCQPMLSDPKTPLWITEGQKKADALASRGLCAIALLGVWNWRGKNEWGGTTVLADFDYIAWDSRDVRIIFDSDVMLKREVRQALDRFSEHIQRKGSHVAAVYLPGGTNRKVGVDDWLAAGHTLEELEALVEAPRPVPQPSAPLIELLDEAPMTMRRPLCLLGGRAYAATWLHVRITRTETVDREGRIIRHDPPLVTTEQRLFVIHDGRVFGDGGDAPLSELKINVHLDEVPPAETIWSAKGVMAYRAGKRPNPVDVFTRVKGVVSRFIDFDRSLAGQDVMSEMVACYVLSTWFLDAFNVIGFLWPNGDRGCGKTQLITIIARLSYLGQVITAGGSFASLRDLADYGATLAFDDAENLADDRKTDPDKRALLLAGNRRGNTVPLKEPGPDNRWHTRYVNTFCPRLFSATRLPDPILASRTIIVPLIRTPDRYRANADPEDITAWPHDRRTLIDDLWALALTGLEEMAQYETVVNERSSLTGRNLEPWRAILAVAAWLDEKGVSGLWERMDRLSLAYQEERPDLETTDITALVIRGLCHCATNATSATKRETLDFVFTTGEIRQAVLDITDEEEVSPDYITPSRVGRALGRMRLAKEPRPGGRGSRRWKVTLGDLQRWTTTYGIKLPDPLCISGTSGTNGTSGTAQGANAGSGVASPGENGVAREVFEL